MDTTSADLQRQINTWQAAPLFSQQPTRRRLAANAPAIRRIRQRLERWELPHLRELAAQQAEQIEQLQAELADTKRQLSWAEDCAESWRNDALDALNEQVDADPEHRAIGLTKSGALMVVTTRPDLANAPTSSSNFDDCMRSNAYWMAPDDWFMACNRQALMIDRHRHLNHGFYLVSYMGGAEGWEFLGRPDDALAVVDDFGNLVRVA